jgi:hypothetical protein
LGKVSMELFELYHVLFSVSRHLVDGSPSGLQLYQVRSKLTIVLARADAWPT